jgi:hypothetical protein
MQKKGIVRTAVIIILLLILFAGIRIGTSCYENRQRAKHQQPDSSQQPVCISTEKTSYAGFFRTKKESFS